jgi:26S proteasome regulatory subunit N12
MSDLKSIVPQLHNALEHKQLDAANDLLSKAKRGLLTQNALIPTPSTPPQLVALARQVLELGAIASIRQTDAQTFTRYYQQLQPFYDLERHAGVRGQGSPDIDITSSQRSKITGLYLLLLLSMGDSANFHTVLEGLVEEASLKGSRVEDDAYIKYPVELERNLMEGSYDKVWRETKSERVPSEDFGLFSNVSIASLASIRQTAFLVADLLILVFIGSHWYHPQRNRRLLREGVPVPSYLQRQEPPLPRVRGRCHRIRPTAWLDPP